MRKIGLFLLCAFGIAKGQTPVQNHLQQQWVDSVYNTFTTDQKFGQLFMVAAYSNKDQKHIESLKQLVDQQQVGGVIFFQGGPMRQANITNELQKIARVPLMVAIDGEWGLAMRLDSTYAFPYNMTLGAVQNLDLIEELGQKTALQAKRMGMQFNFGPVVDINIDPKNPIIGVRSFGEDKYDVTRKAAAFTKGYQSMNIFATAKHFPGHGDTSVDSHYSLPVIAHDKERLNQVELYPYKELIKQDIASIMVAHLNLPAYEPDSKVPSSLSYNIVTKLLREEMGYEGLIFTDALNMKGASEAAGAGEVDLKAFLAGNDLLLFSENVALAKKKLMESYEKGEITEQRLAYSVKKVLGYKYKAGLTAPILVDTLNLVEDLNASVYDDLNQRLFEQAITVLKNKHHMLPVKNLDKQKIGYVALGDDSGEAFEKMLKNYANITVLDKNSLGDLSVYTQVIIGYHKVNNPWRNHDFSTQENAIIAQINKQTKTTLVSFAKAYALNTLKHSNTLDAIILGYQNTDFAQSAAAQIIFGALPSKGKLPVTINDEFELGQGIELKPIHRLGFSSASNVGMNPLVLDKIDSIAQWAIDNKTTPGMQILVARHGKVVYRKSFGYFTYEPSQAVTNENLYDLASLTKILATLPLVMELVDQGKLSLDTTLGQMLPYFKGSNKANISLLNILTHQGGLAPWIPFYKSTLDENQKPKVDLYSYFYTPEFSTQVSEHLFLKKGYTNTILEQIRDSKLAVKPSYKYSDLGFIALKEVLVHKFDAPLDIAVEQQFYTKLGATSLGYLPLRKFDQSLIAPSEVDNYYRYTTLAGYVHDMGAAMQGGVSGHAGLFGNSLDVAKMMQMYLQKGSYGADEFFSWSSFDTFNTCFYCAKGSRRGIGFDKPQASGTPGPTCDCTSLDSFGHTGFTGTMAWADPTNDLVYVFLANRTYPDSSDNQLSKQNVRENIQKLIYQSIED